MGSPAMWRGIKQVGTSPSSVLLSWEPMESNCLAVVGASCYQWQWVCEVSLL